jgi:hypothetical protein
MLPIVELEETDVVRRGTSFYGLYASVVSGDAYAYPDTETLIGSVYRTGRESLK